MNKFKTLLMTIITQFNLSPDELKNIFAEATALLSERIRELEIAVGTKKYAYSVLEVSELIGYSKRKVLEFIKDGRKDRRGRKVKLRHKEITRGEYRVLPADLSEFLSHF